MLKQKQNKTKVMLEEDDFLNLNISKKNICLLLTWQVEIKKIKKLSNVLPINIILGAANMLK